MYKKEQVNRGTNNSVTEEGFDGIRKDNSKKIFYLLLSFIVIDSIYSVWFNND
jgi:hypothetical protein